MNRGSRYFDGNWYCLCGESGTTDEEWDKHIAELPSIEHLMINGREHELLEENNKELKREICYFCGRELATSRIELSHADHSRFMSCLTSNIGNFRVVSAQD